MAESAAKRVKPNPVLIGTHNGHFHADEALAVHMLRLLPAYRTADLVRTRDPAVLETCHTVVDVGGEYDASRHRYDHHQRSFSTAFPGRATKLSSAGLVYMHFGKAIIAQEIARSRGKAEEEVEAAAAPEGASSSDAEVELLWNKIYESFIEAVDANDNGISVYDTDALAAADIKPRFSSGGFTLGAMVSRLNPNWNDPKPTDPAEAQQVEDEHFLRASKRMGEEFELDLSYYVRAWLPARSVVQEAFARRHDNGTDPRGRIVVFEGQSVPWKDHLYTLEEEAAAGGKTDVEKPLYFLYPERPGPDSKWRIQAVPVSKDSFTSRKPLPEAWRGFRDEELDKISGVDGCVFVHAAGFIGGNKTFEGAKALALKALEL
jgi:uncharacterized UPF0160 family protein